VVPIAQVTGPPQSHPELPPHVEVSASVQSYAEQHATPPWAAS
jgi:hypothetical protein